MQFLISQILTLMDILSNEEVNVVGVPQGAYIVTMDAIQSGQIKGYQFKRGRWGNCYWLWPWYEY